MRLFQRRESKVEPQDIATVTVMNEESAVLLFITPFKVQKETVRKVTKHYME